MHVDRTSQTGDVTAYDFPRAFIKEENYKFSFSGLKASAQRLLNQMSDEERDANIENLCASYQQAIVDALLAKLKRATEKEGISRVVVTGGVSANSALRQQSEAWCKEKGLELYIPPLRFCTDNAAMIGLVGMYRLQSGETSEQGLSPSPRPLPEDFYFAETPS